MSHLGESKSQGKVLEEKIGYHIRCRVRRSGIGQAGDHTPLLESQIT